MFIDKKKKKNNLESSDMKNKIIQRKWHPVTNLYKLQIFVPLFELLTYQLFKLLISFISFIIIDISIIQIIDIIHIIHYDIRIIDIKR